MEKYEESILLNDMVMIYMLVSMSWTSSYLWHYDQCFNFITSLYTCIFCHPLMVMCLLFTRNYMYRWTSTNLVIGFFCRSFSMSRRWNSEGFTFCSFLKFIYYNRIEAHNTTFAKIFFLKEKNITCLCT